MFSRPFKKHGAVPLAIYMQICKTGDIADIKGMDTVQKGTWHKYYHGKTGRVYNVTQHALSIIVNKQGAKFLPRELMLLLSILSTPRTETASCQGK